VTHLELEQYVRSLEARVKALEIKPAQVVEKVVEVQKDSGRKMCPHCGEKPNHFFHVKTCAKNKKKKHGETEAPS
jgi:uncharacterized protein (UPF0212 family)